MPLATFMVRRWVVVFIAAERYLSCRREKTVAGPGPRCTDSASGQTGKVANGGLIFDNAGNLYGTTDGGGIHDEGTVFELSPSEAEAWSEKLLHSFDGTDGVAPEAGLIFDAAGSLYGTTYFGGIHGTGTAFRLSPRESGGWTETILHSFGGGTDGRYPATDLIFDAAGNLYGTTYLGGIHPCGGDGCGTVFEITP